MASQRSRDGYGLIPDFERAAVYTAATDPKFWARTGHAIDPESLDLEPSKHIITACRAITEDTGRGPRSATVVIQRLQQWSAAGKLTAKQIMAASDLFDDVEDGTPLMAAEVEAELVPILQGQGRHKVVLAAMDDLKNRGDLTSIVPQIDKIAKLGKGEANPSLKLGPEVAAEIEFFKVAERLPMGLHELDLRCSGGSPRGTLNVIIMQSGGGKSMWLNSQLAAGVMRGQRVLYAIVGDLQPFQVHARAIAALDNRTIDSVMSMARQELEEVIEALRERLPGAYEVREFTPRITSVADIREWVEEYAQDQGVMPEVLIVDYADRMGDPSVQDNDTYKLGDVVYDGLRLLAVDKNMWVWTASQPNRGAGKAKRIDLDQVADSMNKVRVADFILTGGWSNEDETEIEFFVAKNRHGESRFTVGPYSHDFARGRIVEGVEYQAAAILRGMGDPDV